MINLAVIHRMMNLPPPRTICEVGVNAPSRCSLVHLMKLAQKTILVEPLPWLAADLRARFPAADVHELVVGPECGETLLYDRGEGSWIASVPEGGAPDEHERHSAKKRNDFEPQFMRRVKMVTMDRIDDGQIDILAIDIEGAEWFVLRHLVSRPVILRLETHFTHSGYHNPFYATIMEWARREGYTPAAQDVSDSLFVRIP